jgi:hypothetical protein
LTSADAPSIHGVDFTSAPRKAKPITIATGWLCGDAFDLKGIETIEHFARFEAWLMRPGPWIGGFDFPFGMPRAALRDLGWPQTLPALTRHCRALGRVAFRAALDAQRAPRPVGSKFCHRAGDAAARAHSPLKLVNPPVALMFLEGAGRLVEAGVSIPGMVRGDCTRVALEAYPGFAVRQLFGRRAPLSYKNDAPGKQTRAQRSLRRSIVERVSAADSPFGFALRAAPALRRALVADARGDLLDAVLCALQAAWGWLRRDIGYGLPPCIDAVEGWIVTVPAPAQWPGRQRVPAAQPLEAFG